MTGFVSPEDDRYPELLRKIKDPPKRIFYKGEWDERVFENCLSVVGSRKMSSYGKMATKKLVQSVAGVGITIVSGFMYGIDARSHFSCIEAGGRTVAVMPCGIDYIHPENQTDLYYSILENGGLVLSEYEGAVKPKIWMYPKRNRIVAGLSKATLVVEAGIDSGSLITASYARGFGREVFAVPGSIFSDNSLGIYHLIQTGAKMAISAFDILDFYQFRNSSEEHNISKNSLFSSLGSNTEVRSEVLGVLSREPLTLDEIVRRLEVKFDLVCAEITLMVLDGCVFREGDQYYAS